MPSDETVYNAWFHAIYQRMYKHLARHLDVLTATYNVELRQDVDECIQEAFTVLWAKRAKLYAHPNIDGWLYKTVENKLKDRNKRYGMFRKHYFAFNGDVEIPDGRGEPIETLERQMQEIIEIVGQEAYNLLLKYYGDHISNIKLAEEMGITPAALRMRIARIIRPLRAHDFAIYLLLLRYIWRS